MGRSLETVQATGDIIIAPSLTISSWASSTRLARRFWDDMRKRFEEFSLYSIRTRPA
jgi:hypothetical protein